MGRRAETKTKRTHVSAPLLGLVCLCIVASSPSPAEAQRYSSGFLDVLNEACFEDLTPPQRGGQTGPRGQIRVELANSSTNDISRICAYDLTCGEVVFSGRIQRSRRVAFTVCADSRVRGHILLLDPFGTILERRDLRSPATIQVGTSAGR